MYNEALDSLKKYNHQEDIVYQLGLPHIHHVNAAERAIKTLKYHFITGMASTNEYFVSPHPTCHNDLKYVKTLPTKSNYAGIHRN